MTLATPVLVAEQTAAGVHHGTPRVLIVDDDTITTRVLDGILTGAGLETFTAHDLAGAEAVIAREPLSLILLDVHLPDGNGLDLCQRLHDRAVGNGVPVLFISANDDVETKVRGFQAGAVDYIAKPLAGAEVLARVRTHLRLQAAYDTLAAYQAERLQRLASSQESLMPTPEELPEAGFAACVRQAEQAGGDFYDVLAVGNQVHDFVVADASGHDLGVSLWTASFKTLLAEYATVVNTPQDICGMLNRSLRRIMPEGKYFTAIYARLNRATRRLQLVSAGHPAVVLLTPATGEVRVVPQEGDLLGIFADAVFDHQAITVQAGDRIFLYSDGLIEMDPTRDQGLAHLTRACVATAGTPLAEAIPAIVDKVSAGKHIADDIVLMGVEV